MAILGSIFLTNIIQIIFILNLSADVLIFESLHKDVVSRWASHLFTNMAKLGQFWWFQIRFRAFDIKMFAAIPSDVMERCILRHLDFYAFKKIIILQNCTIFGDRTGFERLLGGCILRNFFVHWDFGQLDSDFWAIVRSLLVDWILRRISCE